MPCMKCRTEHSAARGRHTQDKSLGCEGHGLIVFLYLPYVVADEFAFKMVHFNPKRYLRYGKNVEQDML